MCLGDLKQITHNLGTPRNFIAGAVETIHLQNLSLKRWITPPLRSLDSCSAYCLWSAYQSWSNCLSCWTESQTGVCSPRQSVGTRAVCAMLVRIAGYFP